MSHICYLPSGQHLYLYSQQITPQPCLSPRKPALSRDTAEIPAPITSWDPREPSRHRLCPSVSDPHVPSSPHLHHPCVRISVPTSSLEFSVPHFLYSSRGRMDFAVPQWLRALYILSNTSWLVLLETACSLRI